MNLVPPRSLHALAAAALLLAAAPTAGAQGSRNCALLGRFHPGGGYNDIWGYVHPADGREFAIVGGRAGTYIVDCSVPTNPRQTGYIPASASGWGSSTWRDIRTYRQYAYVVTESGGGMQIIDLSNPDSPQLVTTWGQGVWSNAHNIAIDTATGRCYPCGTNVGIPILDITNPTSPQHIATWSSPYVHDLHVQDGVAHLAEINSGGYRLLDVTSPPSFSTIGRITGIPACHNAWPSRDNRLVVLTSESSNQFVTVVDVSVPALPNVLARWSTGVSTSPHNAYLQDRLCHVSYYSEGYRLLDLSTPAQPVEVGYYDTHTATRGFSGCWGCYPFLPSGNILVNDISNGLFVLRPTGAPVRYGVATAGTGGVEPTAWTYGAPWIGNGAFKLELSDARANSTALLVLAAGRGNAALGGVTFNIALGGPLLQVFTSTDGNGDASIPAPVASDAALVGQSLDGQWFVADAGSGNALGIAATRGIELTFFQR